MAVQGPAGLLVQSCGVCKTCTDGRYKILAPLVCFTCSPLCIMTQHNPTELQHSSSHRPATTKASMTQPANTTTHAGQGMRPATLPAAACLCYNSTHQNTGTAVAHARKKTMQGRATTAICTYTTPSRLTHACMSLLAPTKLFCIEVQTQTHWQPSVSTAATTASTPTAPSSSTSTTSSSHHPLPRCHAPSHIHNVLEPKHLAQPHGGLC